MQKMFTPELIEQTMNIMKNNPDILNNFTN